MKVVAHAESLPRSPGFCYNHMMNRKFLALMLISMVLSACATKSRLKADAANPDGVAAVDEDGPPVNKAEVTSQEIQANAGRSYRSEYGEVNLKINSLVEKWIGYFQGRGRHWMELYLNRSTRYMPMMKNTLREYGLPEDLVYVAMIESGFSPVARSRAAAVGYWQFVRATGRTYGLTVNQFIDERRDPVLSTRAAAEYFKALYNLFGSWHLALAAYNSGENRIKSVVMKNFTRDFWELVRLRKIPSETQNYVPKFIAAAMIAKDPARYGFNDIKYEPTLAYDTVEVPNPINIRKMAATLNVDVEELKLLNPKYRTDFVPVYSRSDTILRVPVGMRDKAIASLESAASDLPRVVSVEGDSYRIRKGDSLSTIAARHGTSVGTLQRINNFKSHQVLRVGQKILLPERDGKLTIVENRRKAPPAATQAAVAVQPIPSAAGVEPIFHVVKKGENLSTIARLYSTTVDELKRLNKLNRKSLLKVGDRLIVKEPAEKVQMNTGKKSQKVAVHTHFKITPKLHVVRRGETLAVIAKKYRVSLSDLLAVNDMSHQNVLSAGRSLVIPK